jgi:hypothetical protein
MEGRAAVKTLTKKTAHYRAHALWGSPGIEDGDRVGTVYLGRKTTSKRFRVGYYTRRPIAAAEPVTWMGSSDLSWEAAFTDAERKTVKP